MSIPTYLCIQSNIYHLSTYYLSAYHLSVVYLPSTYASMLSIYIATYHLPISLSSLSISSIYLSYLSIPGSQIASIKYNYTKQQATVKPSCFHFILSIFLHCMKLLHFQARLNQHIISSSRGWGFTSVFIFEYPQLSRQYFLPILVELH